MLANAVQVYESARAAQMKAQNYAKAAKRALSKIEAHLAVIVQLEVLKCRNWLETRVGFCFKKEILLNCT